MSAQEIANALYGLHEMSSADAEVRDVLGALAPKIWECTEELDAQEFGTALYGLQVGKVQY